MPDRVGRYELIDKLARGGMGDIWLARDPELDREVAIKTIRAELEGADASERFLREARAAAQCRHPGIVTIFDFGVHDGTPFLVMERVHGSTLRERLDSAGPIPCDEVMRIGAQLADALAHAHDRGVLHRDITPSNVVIEPNGTARLLDFGLVRELGSPTSELSTHAMLGTPSFLAPEQAFGAPEEVDARADLYGLGATLFAATTGDGPFTSPTLLGLLRKIEEDDVPPTGQGAAIDAILHRALAKDRDARYRSAREMGAALRNWQQTEPSVSSAPAPAAEPVGSRLAWAASILAATVVAVWIGTRWFGADSEPHEAPTVDARAFGLAASIDGLLAELIAEGNFGEAAALRPIPSVESWAALSLNSPPSLRRYIHPGAFRIELESPIEPQDSTPAAVGVHLLRGDVHDALTMLEAIHDEQESTPLLDLLEVHGLLGLPINDFDFTRGERLLGRLIAADQSRTSLRPLFHSGLIDLLRQRTGLSEPLFFDVDEPSEVLERELVRITLLVGCGRGDEALEHATRLHDSDSEDVATLVHLAWLRMAVGMEEQHEFTIEDLQVPLREIVAAEQLELDYPAAIVLGVAAVLAGEDDAAKLAIEHVRELAEHREYELDELPEPIAALFADPDLPRSIYSEALRDCVAAFGNLHRAAEIAAEIDDRGALDIEDLVDRRTLLLDNALARACYAQNTSRRLAFVLHAIELGADEARLEEEDAIEDLLGHPEVVDRLRR